VAQPGPDGAGGGEMARQVFPARAAPGHPQDRLEAGAFGRRFLPAFSRGRQLGQVWFHFFPLGVGEFDADAVFALVHDGLLLNARDKSMLFNKLNQLPPNAVIK